MFVDQDVARLVAVTTVREEPRYNPPRARGRPSAVSLVLNDGRRLSSGTVVPRGGPDEPLSRAEISQKFHDYAEGVLEPSRARSIERAVYGLSEVDGRLDNLLELVLTDVGSASA